MVDRCLPYVLRIQQQLTWLQAHKQPIFFAAVVLSSVLVVTFSLVRLLCAVIVRMMRHAATEAEADATIEESEEVHTIGDEHVQQQHTDEDSRVNANNEEDDGDVRTIPEDVPAPAEDTEETDVILANAVEPTSANLILPLADQPPVTLLVSDTMPRRLTRSERRKNRKNRARAQVALAGVTVAEAQSSN